MGSPGSLREEFTSPSFSIGSVSFIASQLHLQHGAWILQCTEYYICTLSQIADTFLRHTPKVLEKLQILQYRQNTARSTHQQ